MLHWIGLALVALAGVLCFRLVRLRRVRPDVRPSWAGPVALCILAALAITPWFLRVRLEDRLAAVASAIAGREVVVQCQSFAAAFIDPTANAGHVAFDAAGRAEPKTLIKRDQCRDLAGYLRSDKTDPSPEQVIAVHVLTHESVHMSGILEEAETECRAMRMNARTAELLGAPRAAAQELALTYWRDVYPNMPLEYQSDRCRAPVESMSNFPG